MKSKILVLAFFSCCVWSMAQEKPEEQILRKKIAAIKVDKAPKIDGILDDEAWQNAPVAGNFVERSPKNGTPQPDSLRSEVKIVYDDTGIYFGALLHDPEPDKIDKEIVERDDVGNDDLFGVILNGYNDKQQSLEFLVMPTGVQYDAKLTTDNGEDSSWNGVWYSAVKITDQGWIVEIKIPYSELRFPKKDVQEWGLNMVRRIQRTKTMYDWNLVNNQKGSYMLYDGVLQGIENINPPTRLSFTPYFSTYVNNYAGKTEFNVNGGMDLKYGINDAFTFDMTLIPDFGQANFDNTILNLTPFEQQFAEQRSFFTEGTELFSKGNMFYSRRVGGSPSRFPETSETETVTEFPAKVKLFNAFKISGRTKGGLGIGIFNGVTEKMNAIIVDESTGNSRTEVVEPWTNYNVLVLDQRFRENSSVTLVNTNTTRAGDFRDANATGLLWNLSNKSNTYTLYGNWKGSWVMDKGTKFGNRGSIGLGKFSGKNRFEVNANYVNKNWDINDLGFSTLTNYGNHNVWYGYRILQPTEKFNNIYMNFNLNYYHRLEPFLNQKLVFNNNNQLTDKKFQSFGGGIEFTPYGEKDIYEPRTFGRFLNVPGYFDSWLWFESDSRKKLQYNINLDYYAYDEKGRNMIIPSLYLRYRASDKMKFIWQLNPTFSNNEVGFIGKSGSEIYMGRRQRNTYENSITGQYTFNDKMVLSLAFRHYFSDVTYKQFYSLNNDGSLTNLFETTENIAKRNGTYNSWNVDVRYSWWFAPGSQLTLLYRNAVANYIDTSRMTFNENFNTLFNESMTNNFSLRVTYFLDYNRMKHWFKADSKAPKSNSTVHVQRYKGKPILASI